MTKMVEFALSQLSVPGINQFGIIYLEKNGLVAGLYRWLDEAEQAGAETSLLRHVVRMLDTSTTSAL